jgi:hypothetical protein
VARLLALIATAALAWIGLSAVAGEPQPAAGPPQILDVRVVGGTTTMAWPPKSAHAVETHITDTGTVRLVARVQNIDRLDVVVSIDSRTDFGHFSARPHGRFVTIDATLPEVGSVWPVPGGGVGSTMYPYTVAAGEGFILQITGTAGMNASGLAVTVPGPPLRVMRQD